MDSTIGAARTIEMKTAPRAATRGHVPGSRKLVTVSPKLASRSSLGRFLPLLIHSWLDCGGQPRRTDLIFVLAGRPARKAYALRLFEEGFAPRILLSVGRFEIRRFSLQKLPVPIDLLQMAASIDPPQRHFLVCFEDQVVRVQRIAVGRFGTLGEIEALAKWLQEHPTIQSVLIVSSGSHLRRVRICCRKLLPARLQIHLVGVDGEKDDPDEISEKESNVWILTELLKLPLYRILLSVRRAEAATEEIK
jgi:hypothetical protein